MPEPNDVRTWRGCDVLDRGGQKIGRLEEVYYGAQGGAAQWAAVKTGLLGSNLSVVPLTGAGLEGDSVTVPLDEAAVKDAPSFKEVRELSSEEEAELSRYYGMQEPASGHRGSVPYGEMPGGEGERGAEAEPAAAASHEGAGGREHERTEHERDAGSESHHPSPERGGRVRRQVTTEYLSETGEVERRETHTEEERPDPR